MLSVVPIKKSSIETGYYLKQDGNYYIEDVNEKELYQWMGKGAKQLGLVGAIHAKDHVDIYDGVLPANIIVGKRNQDGTLAGRPGYDLTFSMNKELSLIICCTQNKSLKDYFLNAHINAVKIAMNEVEKMTSARKSIKGVRGYELTKNMIASLCTHFSSRAGDPQVHTHALVANVTQRADGQWRALSTDMQRKHGFYEKIRDNATFLGHIYQNEMAIAAKEKGFDITPVNKHGMFTIQSFPDDIRQHFSKRRQQIVSIVESLQYADKNDKILYNHVAQHSKASKQKINHHDFMATSKNGMKQFIDLHYTGKNFDDIVNSCIKQKTKAILHSSESFNEAILDAVNALSRFNVKLNANQIVKKAMQLDLGSSSISALQNSLDRMINAGVLHKTESGHFTSQALIETEKRLIQKIKHTKQVTQSGTSYKPFMSINEVLRRNRFCVIEEPKQLDAKLNLIDTLIHDVESSGKKVTILTPTKSLAFDHNAHDQSHRKSIWQSLMRLGKIDRAHSLSGFLHKYDKTISNPMVNALVRKRKEVFLIDEGQCLGLGAAERLIALTEKRQANLIFLSYAQGKQSQLSGNVISLLKKAEVPVITISPDHIKKRHPDSPIKIHEIKVTPHANSQEKQDYRQKIISEDMVNQFNGHFSDIEILTMSKKSALKQTDLIREKCKDVGLIDRDEKSIETEHRVHLTVEERKQAKFFKKGWVVKTYVGRGQFSEKAIIDIDEENNRLLIKGAFGRQKYISPQQLLTSSNSKLIEKSKLSAANRDRVRLNTDNRLSKQLGLSTNTGYQITFQGNKVILVPENPTLKTIETKLANLNGMDWSHDYTKTIHQVRNLKRSSKKVMLDAPAYSLSKNTINELSRQYSSIDIYTDDQEKAKKKIGMKVIPILSTDLTLVSLGNTVAHRAVNYGLSVISSRDAAFSLEKLTKKAMEYPLERPKYEDIAEIIDTKIQEGDLYSRENFLGTLVATKETVALEQAIIDQIKQGKSAVRPFLNSSAIEKALSETHLTPGQQDACRLLASSSDRFVMVQGFAGSGKSTMLTTLQLLLDQYLPNTNSLIALAPTHKAVKELQRKGLAAQTLKSFLVEHHQTDDTRLKNKLIILDESSMVSNTDFHKLQSIVEKSKTTHCAYIGDISQLLSVEGGKPSEIAYISKEADIATATMDDILRQKNSVLKIVTQHLIKGTADHVQRAFNELDKHHRIITPKESDVDKLLENEDLSNLFPQQIKRKVRSAKITLSLEKLADDYVTLPIEERDHTLVAVATNKMRNDLNEAIRSRLNKIGVLSGRSLSVEILSDSRLTNEELRYAENYEKGNVIKLHQDYYDVVNIFKADNTIKLCDRTGSERIYKLDWAINHELMGLYKKEKRSIQIGDLLKWTKSDKAWGLVAHERMEVVAVNQQDQSIEVLKEDGLNMQIDLKQPEYQHMDYQYASTVHGLQGATTKRMMSLLITPTEKSNTLRLMYVVATRATEEVYLYVDDKEVISRQISENKGDKTSALESMGLLDTKQLDKQKNHSLSRADKKNVAKNVPIVHENKARIDAKQIENELRDQVQNICEDLFGKPNESLSNATNWRYGRKGSLSITVAGQYQGSFYNFETGEKGGMIQLLMSELGLDFKSALAQGHRMLGGDLVIKTEMKSTLKRSIPTKDDAASRKMAYINMLIKQSVPLSGTIAEKYLANRAIRSTSSSDLKFIKKISTGRDNQAIRPFASALLAIARDKKGDAKAVQVTYLDPRNGEKLAGLKIKKRSIGSLKEASVNLTSDIKSPKITFVAEGVETALSIKEAIPDEQKKYTQVLVALGKSNLSKVADDRSAENIVLVLDNDRQDWREDKSIQMAIRQMKQNGKLVQYIQPRLLNNQKTDYNDLAKVGRFDEIRKDIMEGIEQMKSETKTSIDFNPAQQTPRIEKKITKSVNTDRELFG